MENQSDPQSFSITSPEVISKPEVSALIKFVRIFLLILIIIGIGLICTINFWVPQLVTIILGSESSHPTQNVVLSQIPTSVSSTAPTHESNSVNLGDALPKASGAQSPFVGSWIWIDTDKDLSSYCSNGVTPANDFQLTLLVGEDGNLYGEHDVIVHCGQFDDSPETNMVSEIGTIMGNSAQVTYQSSFADTPGKASITYNPSSGTLHWHIDQLPTTISGGNIGYLPKDVTLERSK
jgi:hypothetical protein